MAITVRQVIYEFVWFSNPQYFVLKCVGSVVTFNTNTHICA
jgi:hypothetical protein